MQADPRGPARVLVTLLLALSGWGGSACDPNSGRTAEAPRREETANADSSARPVTDSIRWGAVDQALERKGEMQPGGVHKYSLPRSDLAVSSRGVRIKPALALGSWLAFKPKGNVAVAMGDLVLTEEEYASVIRRLQEGGVAQTAVHKHLLEHSPSLWWTHVHAEGDPVKIAGAVKAALDLTGTPQTSRSSPEPLELDTAAISRALGHTGKVTSGVYQVSVARAETIRAHGMEVPPSMGTATALNFQPTGGAKAAISGDFVMVADEVQPVIATLQASGIQVVALHNHMLAEDPRLFFMHFWAQGNAVKLASGLKAALDKTNSARQ